MTGHLRKEHLGTSRSAEGRSGSTETSNSALSTSFLEVSRTPPPCHLAEFLGEAFGICATLLTAYFGCQRSNADFGIVIHIFQATNPIPTRPPRGASVSLSPAFLIAKTQQQRFKLIKCLLLIGPDRLEDDTGAAIQIGSKHFQ